jgi:tRNA nucleotidyltransferase (CCA-adding enzyme)
MKLTNSQLTNYVNRIKLKRANMPRYRDQLKNLQDDLEKHINEDISNGVRVTKVIVAGSWKKGTILRPTGDNPIDIDVVFYIEVYRPLNSWTE